MPFELRIALRYLTARRKQAFISVISAISMLGVVVGVMALFIALGLMTGLQSEIREKILGATAHVSVFRAGNEGMAEYADVVARLRKAPRVVGAAPVVYGKALLRGVTGSARVATLKGVVPADEKTVTHVSTHVEQGSFEALDVAPVDGLPPMLLGSDLAAGLEVAVGDVVSVTTTQGRLSPMGVLPRLVKFRV